MSSKLKKISGLAAGVVLAIVLAACGGGGSSTPPPVTTCANGASNYPTCSIAPKFTSVVMTPATGATNVSVDTNVQMAFVVDGSFVNGTSTMDASCKKADGTTVVIAGASTIAPAMWTFTPSASLPFSATCTVTFGGKWTNAGGLQTVLPNATTTFTTSTTPVLHYTDKVLTVETGGQVYAVARPSSVTLVTNKTSFTTGAWPLFNCWLAKPSVSILADGKVLHACQDAVTLRRHYLAWNPVNGDQTEYVGPIPATLQCTENSDKTWSCLNTDWVAGQSTPPVGAPNTTGTATKVTDGWYFADGNMQWVLNFKETATGIGSVVKAGTVSVDGTFNVLFTYSNP